jgi:trigger factor
MNVNVEKLEKNLANITVTVPDTEVIEAAITKAYHKVKNQVTMPGFRKGKVPQKMIEKQYGVEVFYEDAANFLISDSYPDAYDEASKEIEIVSSPQIQDIQLERGKDFVYVVQVAVKPEVTLGDYKGLEYTKADTSVPEEEIDKELERVRELNSRRVPVDGRAAKEGDIVDIDFEGFIDGKDFQGGKAEGYILTLGSHSFIDTFEEQLIGKNIGDEVEVNVTFPEKYQAEELQGKPAMFKVNVKGIKTKELPELDDDFAQDVSDFDTLAEYKEDLKKKLTEKKEEEATAKFEEDLVEKVVGNAKMDLPTPMIDLQVKQMVDNFARRISSQGLSIEQYMQFTGMTFETMEEQMRPQSIKTIESRLVLEAIVKAENIQATDEEFDKELEKMASMYQMETDKLKELISDKEKESMKLDIAVQKAVDYIVAEAK